MAAERQVFGPTTDLVLVRIWVFVFLVLLAGCAGQDQLPSTSGDDAVTTTTAADDPSDLAAGSSTTTESTSTTTASDVTEPENLDESGVGAPDVTLPMGREGVIEPSKAPAEIGAAVYFDGVEGLSEATLGLNLPDHFAQFALPRDNERGTLIVPLYLSEERLDELFLQVSGASSLRPTVSYTYECADGRMAHVDHFVRGLPEFHKPWERTDFYGEVTTAADGGTTLATVFRVDLFGHFDSTGVSGQFGGAEYALKLGLRPIVDPEAVELGLLYGFYQFYSFVDEEGVEVEVLVTAASYDIATEGIQVEVDPEFDLGETILDGPVNPLDLVDNEVVQARFACGRELNDLIAPVVASLDQSVN